MNIDRQHALDAFTTYVQAYDPKDPLIALKVAHTLRVATLCDDIAASVGLDQDFAWLCGLLHDIGRFEQVRRYGTFNDAESVSHAALGVEVLFGAATGSGGADVPVGTCTAEDARLIRRFVSDPAEDDLIHTVIATHSDYRLPADQDARTRAYCDVLRDADKIDILKVNGICPIQDVYGVSEEEMLGSKIAPAVVDAFYEHHAIPRDVRKYPADKLIGHLCFAWELVYPRSMELAKEQGYLVQLFETRLWDPESQATFSAMVDHMRHELHI